MNESVGKCLVGGKTYKHGWGEGAGTKLTESLLRFYKNAI